MNQQTRLKNIFLVFCLSLTAVLPARAANFVVVINKRAPNVKFSSNELNEIFLGNKLYWPDGARIHPVRLENGASSSQSFMNDQLHISMAQYLSHWRRRFFAGRATPPRIFTTNTELLDFVSKNPNAIGIADSLDAPFTEQLRTFDQ